MPGLDDLKNATKGIVDTMVDNAKEAAEEIVGKDLNNDGVIGDGVEDGPVYGNTASVVDTVHDIANNPAEAAAGLRDTAKSVAGGLASAAAGIAGATVNKVEELSGKDLNGDGAVAGAIPEAPAAEEPVKEAPAEPTE